MLTEVRYLDLRPTNRKSLKRKRETYEKDRPIHRTVNGKGRIAALSKKDGCPSRTNGSALGFANIPCRLSHGHLGTHAGYTIDSLGRSLGWIWNEPEYPMSYPIRWLSDLDKPGQSYVVPMTREEIEGSGGNE